MQTEFEYENYHSASNFYDFTRRPVGFNVILDHFKPDFKILDAGCGSGNFFFQKKIVLIKLLR